MNWPDYALKPVKHYRERETVGSFCRGLLALCFPLAVIGAVVVGTWIMEAVTR